MATGSFSACISEVTEGFMYPVSPLKVRFPSGAMAMVPPSLATCIQLSTARTSVVDFFMGIGFTRNFISLDTKPFENRSSDAT